MDTKRGGFVVLTFALLYYFVWTLKHDAKFLNKTYLKLAETNPPETSAENTINRFMKNFHTISVNDAFVTFEEPWILTEKEVLDNYCTEDLSNSVVRLDENQNLPMSEYKIYIARRFVETFANPFKKSQVPPTLKSYENVPRPLPSSRLHKASEKADFEAVMADIEEHRKKRMDNGDDDVSLIKEVQEELKQTEYSVPNLIHFIWFGCGRRFRIDHYISVLGALRYQQPKLILFHKDCEPVGEYWRIIKMQAGNVLRVVNRRKPDEIWGRKIEVVEHAADVARLQIMLEVGGIYLDTDSAVLKSLDSLRNHEMVLSESNTDSLANGIIFANRSAWFLHRWYWEYKYFADSMWGHNSVLVPWALWRLFPEKIHVVKELICRPNWQELSYIFHELYDWHNNYIMHLYSRFMKKWDGKTERPLKELAVLNTTYGQIARHIIWGDEKTRDITNWVVTCNLTDRLLLS